jgi:5-formyltetrahydrofolate cyclo-ligase
MTDEPRAGFASPPCYLHEFEPDEQQRLDVMRWRKAERARLLAARAEVGPDERRRVAWRISAALDALLGDVAGHTIGVYWPIRGEPDLRPWMESVRKRGGTCALPVVVAPRTPVEFRPWHPGIPLARGVWDIPVPAEGAAVVPDIVIAPLVGFDAGCYRLGYGGGYYDRTLAALRAGAGRVRAVGFAWAAQEMAALPVEAFDARLDAVVTEKGLAVAQ